MRLDELPVDVDRVHEGLDDDLEPAQRRLPFFDVRLVDAQVGLAQESLAAQLVFRLDCGRLALEVAEPLDHFLRLFADLAELVANLVEDVRTGQHDLLEQRGELADGFEGAERDEGRAGRLHLLADELVDLVVELGELFLVHGFVLEVLGHHEADGRLFLLEELAAGLQGDSLGLEGEQLAEVGDDCAAGDNVRVGELEAEPVEEVFEALGVELERSFEGCREERLHSISMVRILR